MAWSGSFASTLCPAYFFGWLQFVAGRFDVELPPDLAPVTTEARVRHTGLYRRGRTSIMTLMTLMSDDGDRRDITWRGRSRHDHQIVNFYVEWVSVTRVERHVHIVVSHR